MKNNDFFCKLRLAMCVVCTAIVATFFSCKEKTEGTAQQTAHCLESEMVLDYDDSIQDAEKVDALLGIMMKSLWNLEDSASCDDPYWGWCDKVTAYIDSLYENEGMFRSEDINTTRYELAMNSISEYIDISCAGSQAAMNCASYVFATERHYLMMLEQQRLVRVYPEYDFKKEYELYKDYVSSLHEWRTRYDDAMKHYYSMRPLEINGENEERYDQRAADILAIQAAFNQDTTILRIEDRPEISKIKKSFHEIMPGIMRPARYPDEMDEPFYTDTLGIHYIKWIDLRDEIAKKMPTEVAESYRNQTTNHIINTLKYLSVTFGNNP